jgi:hypothetical protein
MFGAHNYCRYLRDTTQSQTSIDNDFKEPSRADMKNTIPLKVGRLVRSPVLLFGGLIVVHAAIFFSLYAAGRIPNGHDGFHYLTLQYDFLNSAVTTGEIPQWMPLMTQGMIATWDYLIQAAPLQAVLLILGPILKNTSFLSWFYLGIFVDILLFLVGVWLLASRFMASYTAVFLVTATSTFSTIWHSQIWFNLHFFYAIPLILHFLHVFLDKGRSWNLFLAGSLFVLQIFANAPYFSSMVSFLIAVYFVTYCTANWTEARPQILRTLRNWHTYPVLVLLIGMVGCAYFLLSYGTQEIAYSKNLGRSIAGTVDFHTFVTYAAKLKPARWAELIIGIAPAMDYSLFVGYLALPLVAISIIATDRHRIQFLVIAAVFALLAYGVKPVAFLYFYLWPLGKFYRHLALVVPFVRLCLCFMLGFGVDWVLRKDPPSTRAPRDKWLLSAGSVVLLLISVALFWIRIDGGALTKVLSLYRNAEALPSVAMRTYIVESVRSPNLLDADEFGKHIVRSAVFAFVGGVVGLGLAASQSTRLLRKWLVLACAVQILDIGSYYLWETIDRTYPLNVETQASLAFQEVPYAKRRISDIFTENPRFRNFLVAFPFMGATYSSYYPFFFADSISSAFRTDYWLEPMDDLLAAYGFVQQEVIPATAGHPLLFRPFSFPTDKPSAAKLAGLSEDKLQFFGAAHVFPDKKSVASSVADPRFLGDTLLLQGDSGADSSSKEHGPNPSSLALAQERVPLEYQVTRYDSNHLTVVVSNGEGKARWLFYSDVWHPGWKAKINGQPVTIYRANLAYKAVSLIPGPNVIELEFKSSFVVVLQYALGILSCFWLVVLAYLLYRIPRA